MARSLSQNQKLTFILTILQNTALRKPDYHTAARKLGISTANQTQVKFRAIVQSAGFDLVKDQIIDATNASGNDGGGAKPPTPINPDRGVARKARGGRDRRTGGGGANRSEEAKTMSATRSPEQIEMIEPPKKKRRLEDDHFPSASSTAGTRNNSLKAKENEAVDGHTTAEKNDAERGFILLGKNGGIKHFSSTTHALQRLEGFHWE